jgi:predicted type IV restriction endonuclease
MMTRETDARIVIDRLLRESGWDIENKAQVSTEEPAKDGRADYLFKNTRTQPLAIIEAKRFFRRLLQRKKTGRRLCADARNFFYHSEQRT